VHREWPTKRIGSSFAWLRVNGGQHNDFFWENLWRTE